MPIAARLRPIAALCIAAALAFLCMPASATLAQSCSFSVSTVDFGTITVGSGGAIDTTSSLAANCSGTPGATVRVCVSFGAGSGSAANGGSPRYMKNGANALGYNLYTDAARTDVWGSWTGLLGILGPATLSVPLNAQGVGSVSVPIYGRINGGQQSLPAGLYQSVFSGTESRIAYQYLSLLNCLAILSPTTSVSFTVQANILTSCTLSATTLDFGAVTNLNQAVDGVSTITSTCQNTIPYSIALSGGNAAATDPGQRKMTKGTDQVTYGLYQDASRATPWGDVAGSNVRSLVGTGSSQPTTVYGRIPAQANRPPGTYTDTVVVTLTY